ncbi:putative bifunctional diguanylate cyclase/phosphodiesterase [Geodermatophilus nigrescens]|uniref:PAS domain S-box-containing protein/diguanylate cyclase (GGDEF) domain-containing protein n=1 Tax=Geodermatophilus nigrescens TaxID=1070870 RepID=A0A1M5CZA6_9ACTN|nr:GGDEF domain-containing phosphodiesterase [Geodermatophilus nigrescens]SHF60049.1 PAS domain S-box-containing protein/diguanylate cyclase (GGDEF) domain-containing protein [Geodermatophilus nigrescens]
MSGAAVPDAGTQAREDDAAALERSRRWLAEAQRLAALGSWEWDVRTGAVLFSDELRAVYRLDPSVTPTFATCLEMVHPDDRPRAERAILAALTDGGVFDLDHRVVCGDGEVIWVRARGSVTRGEDGSPLLLVGTAQDVTERVAIEARLQESERRLLEAQRVARLGRWDWDVRSDVVVWSDDMFRIFGIPPAALEPTVEGYLARVHPDDRDELLQMLADVRAGREDYALEHRVLRADGSVGWVSCRAAVVRDDDGAEVRLHGTATDVTERKLAELAAARATAELAARAEQLRRLAFTDPLTGLANRALFADRLQHALDARSPAGVSVLLVDLDDFKDVNDVLGHQVGDRLLVEVAGRLTRCVRPEDTVARLGGDEFAVVLAEAAHGEQVARRIGAALDTPVRFGDRQLVPTGSIGLARVAGGEPVPADVLLQQADIAMYAAKRAGKGRYEVFDPTMSTAVLARADVENGLRQALDRDELVVHLQPLVDVTARAATRVEALVRWPRPSGLALPADFLPVAERSGLVRTLGQQVLRAACRGLAPWLAADPGRSVAVNVSPVQLREPDFATTVLGILARTGVGPRQLLLEVTETLFLEAGPRVVGQLAELRAAGIRVAIDDFGTGYSSLGRLQDLPVDGVKVDRTFVQQMGAGPGDAAILTAMVTLAHDLGLEVTAEGVETRDQATRLLELGVDHLQGHHLARPVPLDALDDAVAAAGAAVRAAAGCPGRSGRATVQLVAGEDALGRAVRGALVRAGLAVAGPGEPPDAVVLVTARGEDALARSAALRPPGGAAVLVLCARADRATRARLLAAGADDVVVDPGCPAGLADRVRGALRTAAAEAGG